MALTPDPSNVKPWPEDRPLPHMPWGWPVVFGICLIVLGCLAMSFAFATSLATVYVFGIFLLIGGVMEVVGAFVARPWRSSVLHLLAGVLYLVVGGLVVAHPFQAVVGVTLVMAVFFLVGGLMRMVLAVSELFPNWGWLFLNGVITFLLGIFIWRRWPWDSFWVVGVFLGVELIFSGWWWVMLGLTVRGLWGAPRASGSIPSGGSTPPAS